MGVYQLPKWKYSKPGNGYTNVSKKNYTENHIWCHREVARVLQTYQSAWKSYAKKLVPQISGQLGHFSNDEICNFDSKVTIKIAQTNSGSK